MQRERSPFLAGPQRASSEARSKAVPESPGKLLYHTAVSGHSPPLPAMNSDLGARALYEAVWLTLRGNQPVLRTNSSGETVHFPKLSSKLNPCALGTQLPLTLNGNKDYCLLAVTVKPLHCTPCSWGKLCGWWSKSSLLLLRWFLNSTFSLNWKTMYIVGRMLSVGSETFWEFTFQSLFWLSIKKTRKIKNHKPCSRNF